MPSADRPASLDSFLDLAVVWAFAEHRQAQAVAAAVAAEIEACARIADPDPGECEVVRIALADVARVIRARSCIRPAP